MPKEESQVLLSLAPEPGGEFGPVSGANFPVQLTTLIGRGLEVAAALEMMRRPEVRLLTFTGPGGVGKTRLALRVVENLVGEFEDGVYLVSLAPVRDPDLVVPAIGRTLGITEVGEKPLHERLSAHLRDKRTLLLLDNFEHVAPAATVVSGLLTTCPGLAVLATSRERLHLSGEHEYPVPPLSVPDRERLPPPKDLTRYKAVALFVERARAARPDFRLTEENAEAVVEICARLDGLPLAIELAAARVKLLPPQALLTRLQQGSGLLRGGGLDLPARQRTLRSTLQWSHDLLDEHEQRMLRRLSIFAGGCTLHAAEAVSGATGDLPAETLELVASLVDKNLLRQVEGAGGEPRLFMLETIREYALERLAESGEAEIVRRAHADYYLVLAEEAEPKLMTAEQMTWLDLLEREHNNLRVALRWSLDLAGAETALRLVGALWRFWHVRGHLSEGRRWLEEALALDGGEPSLRARVLSGGCEVAHSQGDLTLDRVAVKDNTAYSVAGIFGDGGTLDLTDSTVSGNSATGNAGGVYGVIQSGGTANITNTTISGNQAPFLSAGVLATGGARVDILNSTIASNTSGQLGGGILTAGTGTLVTVKNTIVSGNTLDNCDTTQFGGGTISSQGNNISSDASCPFTKATDKQSTNPRLGPLQNNGGPTDTRALLAGSPAIDVGTNTGCPATDQRGVRRPQGLRCDIGAFERPNVRPIARNDAYRGVEDKILRVPARGVLRNDTDADGDALRASIVSKPKKGTLTLRPNGSFVYKPKKDFNGVVRFVYRASDGRGGTDTATVTLRIKARPG